MSHSESKLKKVTNFSQGTLRMFLRWADGTQVPYSPQLQVASGEDPRQYVMLAFASPQGTVTIALRREDFSKMMAEHCGTDVTVAVQEADHE